MRTIDASQPPSAPRDKHTGHVVHGRAIKVVVPLDAAELVSVPTPDGQPRCLLRIEAGGRVLTTDLSAKSVRKAKAMITEHGAENVAVIVQGKLIVDRIEDAGLVAQPKPPKPGVPAEAS